MESKMELCMSRTLFKGHFILGEMREERCIARSGSTFKCQLPEALLEMTKRAWGRGKATSLETGKILNGGQINAFQRELRIAIHINTQSTVVSFNLQVPALTCNDPNKTFCRQAEKAWEENGWVIQMLCWDSGNKTLNIQLYQMFSRCLFSACLYFPLEAGTCIDTCRAFRIRGKSTAAEYKNTFPETITHSPKHFRSKPPHCYASAFRVTTGQKLSLTERGNISVSLLHLISNQRNILKNQNKTSTTPPPQKKINKKPPYTVLDITHFIIIFPLIHAQNILLSSFSSR